MEIDPDQLNSTELLLVAAVLAGAPLSLEGKTGDPPISATLIEQLLTSGWRGEPLPGRGVHIEHGVIDGGLDLTGARVDARLTLRRCDVEGGVSAPDSHLGPTSFEGSAISQVDLAGAHLAGDLVLDRARIERGICLISAEIAGSLRACGATISAPSGPAVEASRLRVSGSLLLGTKADPGFDAHGQVRLVGAEVGDALALSGARLHGRPDADEQNDRHALVATRLRVGGSVFMRNGFVATGGVRFFGARIDGRVRGLDMSIQGDEPSLSLVATKVGQDVRFTRAALGRTHLERAMIGGDLWFDRCSFEASSEPVDPEDRVGAPLSLGARGARVEGLIRFKRFASPVPGAVDLSYASSARLEDDLTIWPSAASVDLRGFEYQELVEVDGVEPSTRVRMLERQDPFASQPFTELARSLRSAGHQKAATTILRARDRRLLCAPGTPWRSRLWSSFLWLTVDYGRRPLRVLLIVAVATTVAALTFAKAAASNDMVPTAPPANVAVESSTCTDAYPCFDPWVYATETAVPLVDLGQTSAWRPADDASANGLDPLLVDRLLTALGWIASTALIAGVGHLFRERP